MFAKLPPVKRLKIDELERILERLGESRVLRYVGIHRTTLYRWRMGKVEVPEASLDLLRVRAGNSVAGVDKAWDGWCFEEGKLVSPCRNVFVTPAEVQALFWTKQARP